MFAHSHIKSYNDLLSPIVSSIPIEDVCPVGWGCRNHPLILKTAVGCPAAALSLIARNFEVPVCNIFITPSECSSGSDSRELFLLIYTCVSSNHFVYTAGTSGSTKVQYVTLCLDGTLSGTFTLVQSEPYSNKGIFLYKTM